MKNSYKILVAAVVTLVFNYALIAQVSPAERQALIDLYKATDGDNWTNTVAGNKPWLINDPNSPVSTWYGISTLLNKVGSILLYNNNLRGTIPDSFNQLSGLYGVSLQGNQLTGSIPQDLSNLTQLQSIRLGNNQLSGSIIGLSTLPIVHTIYINDNQFLGNIPIELNRLERLLYLGLNGNQFSGEIPRGLAQLSNLRQLNLQYNQLSGSIPSEFGQLSNLEHLNLRGNELSGSIPSSLGQLTNLKDLRLDGNKLSGTIPSELGQLSKLNTLFLSSNQFSGKIPLITVPNKFSIYNNKLGFVEIEENFNAIIAQVRSGFRYSPQPNVDEPESLSVPTGASITLKSNVISGPNDRYQWTKRANSNSAYRDIPGATGRNLVLENVTEADAGEYIYKLTNTVVTGLTLLRNPITLTVTPAVNTCGVSAAEKQALIDFYNATGGPNWKNNTNWLTDAPVCDWQGVVVRDGKVQSLYSQVNNLKGTLPPSMGQLIHLEILNLSDNAITGSIPSELTQLANLRSLTLARNQLSGAIPIGIGQLTNLSYLDFRSNKFSGTIPLQISQLSNLTHLLFGENKLTGPIPAALGLLQKLRRLDLYGNQLTGAIPTELGQLINLEDLFLFINQLTGSIPLELGNLSKLKNLIIYSNQFSGPIPKELGQLTNLESFQLSSNLLDGSIPADLVNFNKLRKLEVQSNAINFRSLEPNFTAFQTKLGANFKYAPQAKVDQTETLSVLENGAITLTSTALTSINNTYQWYKNGIAITGATSKDLVISNANAVDAGVYHFRATNSIVTGLTLERNPITLTVDPNTCGVSLVEKQALLELYNSTNGSNWKNTLANDKPWDINIPVCDWYGVTVVKGKVTGLDLFKNNVEGVLPNSIGNLLNLTSLTFSSNKLSGTLPVSLGQLVNLNRIALSGNNLSGQISGPIFSNLKKLYYLYLDRNNFTGSIPPELGQLSRAIFINLGSNEFTGTIPAELMQLSNIKTLHFYKNQLSGAIPSELGNLKTLVRFTLSDNQFSGTIPSELGQLTNLKTLTLRNNQLGGSIPKELGNLAAIESLNLSGNQLTGALPPELGQLTNLLRLELYKNLLSGTIPVQLSKLIKLKTLQLAENQLVGTIPSELGRLINLEYLALYDNQLTGSIPDSLGQLQRLGSMFLYRNQLSGKIPAVLSTLPNFKDFRISRNQFVFSDFELEYQTYKTNLSRFSYKPQNKIDITETISSVVVNGGITLRSNLFASPNNLYQWYKDGVIIAGETSIDLVITNATEADSGVYHFTVTNTIINDLTLERNPITLVIRPIDATLLTECDTCKSFKPTPGAYIVSGWVKEERQEQVENYTNTAITINIANNSNTVSTTTFSPSGDIIDGWQRITGQFSISDSAIGLSLDLVNDNTPANSESIQYDQFFEDIPLNSSESKTTGYRIKVLTDLSSCEAGTINVLDFDREINVYASYYMEVGKIYKIVDELSATYIQVISRNLFGVPTAADTGEPKSLVKKSKYNCRQLAEAITAAQSTTSVMAYFDDIRIHPFNGNMKSFVYDPNTQRLMAELDENNYATFYEYDQEGGLIRVKKETEKGVYTIQETRSSSAKKL